MVSEAVEKMKKMVKKMDRLYLIIMAAGVIFFLWFAGPMLGRIVNIGNVTGAGLAALLFFYGMFHRRVHALVSGAWTRRGGKAVLLLVAVLAVCVLAAVVTETVLMVREAGNQPPQNTTAVVLGCSVRGETPSRILRERLDAAYTYLTENPDAVCVLSGGQGAGENISEAECMYRYLTGKGIAAERLLLEDASTTTEENLLFSMELLAEQGISGEITIITSEFHEYRANKTAERLGITAYSTPSHTALLYLPTYYVRELYGILYYRMK